MDRLISPERFSDLVGFIYDAAIDPTRWPVAMEAIRVELDFQNSTLSLQLLPSGDTLTNVTCNIPPSYVEMMDRAGADVLEQWGGPEVAMSLPLHEPAVLTRVNPAFDFDSTRNQYAVNFAKPQGIVDVMAIGLARSSQAIGSLAFGRHKRSGPIGEREIEIATLLVPHLQRAATINRMLDAGALAKANFTVTLDRLSAPVFLIAQDMRIIHANPAARAIVETDGGLSSRQNLLVAKSGPVNNALMAAVRQSAQDQSQLARRGLGIPLRGANGVAAALHVLPLRLSPARADNEPVAAVFVAAADTPFVAPSGIVEALFDLTPAEAKVFACIAQGETLTGTAKSLGVKHSTCKTHLLRIYDKMGASRQADLILIAAALTAPIVA